MPLSDACEKSPDHYKEMEEKTACPNLSFFNDYMTANKQHFKDPPAKEVGRVNQTRLRNKEESTAGHGGEWFPRQCSSTARVRRIIKAEALWQVVTPMWTTATAGLRGSSQQHLQWGGVVSTRY
ncbi:hypothetical protein Syun_012480 [Stephania yunnanensis]|uniref:Uncharacterized protein n=1 Tax=Stephania yunnanensis TaxID=152371 RepID=A0AAP0PJ07_9MAGN